MRILLSVSILGQNYRLQELKLAKSQQGSQADLQGQNIIQRTILSYNEYRITGTCNMIFFIFEPMQRWQHPVAVYTDSCTFAKIQREMHFSINAKRIV